MSVFAGRKEVPPLEAARLSAGLTLAQIARDLGVKPPTVWRWIHGQRRADPRLFLILGLPQIAQEHEAWAEEQTGSTFVLRTRLPKGTDPEQAREACGRALAALAGGAA